MFAQRHASMLPGFSNLCTFTLLRFFGSNDRCLQLPCRLCMGGSAPHKRSKANMLVFVPADASAKLPEGTAAAPTTLLSLQTNVLEHVLLSLHLTDLARCCQVCKGLRSIVQQEDIWKLLCANAFPSLTCPELKQWLHIKSFPVASRVPQQPPTSPAIGRPSDNVATYRSLILSVTAS